jgi:hypothetical protein
MTITTSNMIINNIKVKKQRNVFPLNTHYLNTEINKLLKHQGAENNYEL